MLPPKIFFCPVCPEKKSPGMAATDGVSGAADGVVAGQEVQEASCSYEEATTCSGTNQEKDIAMVSNPVYQLRNVMFL